MKKAFGIFAVLAILVAVGSLEPLNAAAAGRAGQGLRGHGFVDENGDGYNDNAPDADGDGIPNGRDEDFVRSAYRNGQCWNDDSAGRRGGFWQRTRAMHGYRGEGDFSRGRRGFASTRGGASGSGVCDGNGPHGRWAR